MPFYTWLKPRYRDQTEDLKTKQRSVAKIKELRRALKNHIQQAELPGHTQLPSDSSKFIRLATWNLREFDSTSYGSRTQESLAYIAEILSHFDLIALQEIRRDLGPLKELISLLGRNEWDYIATDVTEGTSGNRERMAYLFNKNKVWFRNVAGELTLPAGSKVTDPFGERFMIEGGPRLELPDGEILTSPTGLRTDTLASGQTKIEEMVEIPLPDGAKVQLPPGTVLRFARNARVPITPENGIEIEATSNPGLPEAAEIVLPPNSILGGSTQFARTPFIVSFQTGWLKLNLATVHIYYGSGSAGMSQRKEEIRRLTELLAGRARSDSDSDAESYFIALGDFNIVHREHETMQALLQNDFIVPKPLQTIPGSNVKRNKYYDQIALWDGENQRRKAYTRIQPYRAGVFDFYDVIYREDEEDLYRSQMKKPGSDDFYESYKAWRTHQLSDHLPMWVELQIDFSEEYLTDVENKIQEKMDD